MFQNVYLQIAVNNITWMEVFQCWHNLCTIEACPVFCEHSFPRHVEEKLKEVEPVKSSFIPIALMCSVVKFQTTLFIISYYLLIYRHSVFPMSKHLATVARNLNLLGWVRETQRGRGPCYYESFIGSLTSPPLAYSITKQSRSWVWKAYFNVCRNTEITSERMVDLRSFYTIQVYLDAKEQGHGQVGGDILSRFL